jgi:hypothetical protein
MSAPFYMNDSDRAANGYAAASHGYPTTSMRRFWLLHPGAILFLTLLVLPVGFNAAKAALFALVLYFATLHFLWKRATLKIHPVVAAWFLFYVCLGLFFVTYGTLRMNPGAMRSALIYCVWPIVYMLLVACVYNLDHLRKLTILCIWGTIAVGAITCTNLLVELGYLPAAMQVKVTDEMTVAVYEGFAHTWSPLLSTLIFTVPFLIGLVFTYPQRDRWLSSRTVIWLALGIGVLGTLLGGRKAAILTMIMAPAVAWLLARALPTAKRRFSQGTLKIAALGTLGSLVIGWGLGRLIGWTAAAQIDFVISGFELASRDQSRRDQLVALFSGFLENPVLGSGFGAPVAGLIRNLDRPWEYEMQYALMLYHTGALGFVAYAAGIVWIYWQGIRIIRGGGPLAELMVAALTGTTSFLVANATNPYLQAYGQLWTLFLPVAVINVFLIALAAKRSPGELQPDPVSSASPSGEAWSSHPARAHGGR